MQICTSPQTDNHASAPSLSFLQASCPSCRPTNSVKALPTEGALSGNFHKLVERCILQDKVYFTVRNSWRDRIREFSERKRDEITWPPVRQRRRQTVCTAARSLEGRSRADSRAVPCPADSGLPAVPDHSGTEVPPSRRRPAKQAVWSPAAENHLYDRPWRQGPDSDCRNSTAAAGAGRFRPDD